MTHSFLLKSLAAFSVFSCLFAILSVKERQPEGADDRQNQGVLNILKQVPKLICNPCMRKLLFFILITRVIGFLTEDCMKFKLIDTGVSKDTLSEIDSFSEPVIIFVAFASACFLKNKTFLRRYHVLRIALALSAASDFIIYKYLQHTQNHKVAKIIFSFIFG